MANETTTLLQKVTVGAAGASSITISNIPQGYTDLQIVAALRSDRATFANSSARINLNSSSTGITSVELGMQWNDATFGNNNSSMYVFIPASGTTSSIFSNSNFYIPNYTSSSSKSVIAEGVMEHNATGGTPSNNMFSGLWANSAAVTSITLTENNGANFVQYSTVYVYGIVKQGVTPAATSTPYATGGDSITFDGTNWIHTFRSTGTFTPSKALTCDYLVVAGGGGGGAGDGITGNGGGGAGGYRTSIGGSGLSCTAQAYTVTVGAGGAGGISDSGITAAGNGSDSIFSTITSTGGGRGASFSSGVGGTRTPRAAGNGGSGGGGALDGGQGAAGGTGNTPSTSPSQGNNGGTENGAIRGAGGGGGAGAAGGNATTSPAKGGDGGAGIANSISGSSVTYAGGGGGGAASANSFSGGSGGAGGGGAGSNSGNGSNGTVNLGGGGGGQGNNTSVPNSATGGNGGSGIVIIRYPA